MFDEAQLRDPQHQRGWVALVDGNKHQIDRIHAEAAARTVKVVIVVDFIHVMDELCSHYTRILSRWSFSPVAHQKPLLLLGSWRVWSRLVRCWDAIWTE